MESKALSGLKVRYLGKSSPMTLTQGKTYNVISIEYDCYRIIDDTDEDYLYPTRAFEKIEQNK